MSGATARYDVVNFPSTKDDFLSNGLRGVLVDAKNKDCTLIEAEYQLSSGDFEKDMAVKTYPPGEEMVFKTRDECDYIVDMLGSHYGDLAHALKKVAELSDGEMTTKAGSMKACEGMMQ